MSVIDYILDIFDAISTRKDKKEYIKKLEEYIDSQESLIVKLRELKDEQEKYIDELKDINAQLLDQLEKSQALSESQYNKIVFICTENVKLQSNEREYKCKIDVLIKALTDTRQYLKCIETGEDFVSANPPSGQLTAIDAVLKEAKVQFKHSNNKY